MRHLALFRPADERPLSPTDCAKILRVLLTAASLILITYVNAAANQLTLSQKITRTDVTSSGVGLRTAGSGNMSVSGISGNVTHAYLYWHSLTRSTNPAVNASVTLDGNTVTGINIGFSADNCWGFTNSQAYRADVTSLVSSKKNGSYALSGFNKTDVVSNGASLVVFFQDGNATNDRDVYLFDGNDSNINNTFDPDGWDALLAGLDYSGSGAPSLQLHVGDGQPFNDGALLLNGNTLVPASQIFSGTLGDFWDINTYNIASFLSPGINSLRLTSPLGGDCLGLIGAFVNLPAKAAPSTALAGDLIISEYRLRGPAGPLDEFVELYNTHSTPLTVDGDGWALVSSDSPTVPKFVLPVGTVIPARGHYLVANNTPTTGYSLGSYPSGNNGSIATRAAPNGTYMSDIPDNAGIALFNTADPAHFTLANRLDAVGSTPVANSLFREGAGLPPITLTNVEYSFVRDECGKQGNMAVNNQCPSGGLPVDTDDNAHDFFFVETTGADLGAGQRLGAPGPQNLTSPINRNSSFSSFLLDQTRSATAFQNRGRDTTADPAHNSTLGTLDLRRRYTNNTGGAVTRLRFRIVDVTTYPRPNTAFADVRALSSPDITIDGVMDAGTCGASPVPCSVVVRGLTLEAPPAQAMGGGFNATLSAGVVTLAEPLAQGASINVGFRLGVETGGSYRFLVNLEALP